ncbi:SusC/RagA family TonB-linked outer membrane protein [Siphonobacter sp. BAB-5405]|uniref:SusC/RagA family TonB-linked outer membrane protein n=2 Tax=unclassified Siphonobacter TaxID=2635712 RepID=UPI000C7FB94E|nr:TonB-dependent receptor [Siphonobacter sp. BAB-5405]PMD90444.1 SusC/RagA family TonB-linked outer membrane protein [Siphonobacter sp. BAB-5405]
MKKTRYFKPYALAGWLLHRSFLPLLLTVPLFSYAEPIHTVQDVLERTVTLPAGKVSLEQALSQIENQASVKFVYSRKVIQSDQQVSVKAMHTKLEEVLKALLGPLAIQYRLVSGRIVLSKSQETMLLTAPKLTVTGTVTDNQGQTLTGVSVVLKGTTTGSATDANGRYTLNVPDDAATLVFSYVGYVTQEVAIGGRSAIDVKLETDTKSLSEVVVIGYGTQKRSDVTGSLASVSSKELNELPVVNAVQGLAGRAAGVQVVQNSGAPGANISIRVRGGNSLLGNNEPLYVVDGFALSGSPTTLNPADIESMEILKDASATAIYGSRGANGVVLITTRAGKSGSNRVNIDSYVGFQTVRKKLDLLNAREFAEIANERARNDGLQPYFTSDQVASFGQGTDWQDAIFRTAPIQNHVVTFSGGSEKTQYSVSASLFDQQGIVIGSGYKRYSVRANLNQKINDKLRLTYTSVLSRTGTQAISSDNSSRGNGVVSAALTAPPMIAPYDANGNYSNVVPYSFSPNAAENAVALALERKNETTGSGILTNLGLTYEFIPGLSLRVSAGVDYANSRTDIYSPRLFKASPSGSGSTNYYTRTNFLNENILTYSKTIQEAHALSFTGGFTYQSELINNNGLGASGFTSDVLENNNPQSGSVIATPTASISDWKLLSGLARANYSYRDRYLLTASIRADGSSRFGASNKWGYFPSAALGWRISEEEFIKPLTFVSNLKLRASWGQTGSTAINPYQTLNTLQSMQVIYGNDLYAGFAPGATKPNPNLKWETTTQTNLGLDFGFFQERLRLSVDYYRKNTNDLLARVPLPSSSGYTEQVQNLGTIRNQGVELDLGGNILTGNFKWDASLNFAANRNKVIKLAGGSDVFGNSLDIPLNVSVNLIREGEPVGVFFGYVEDGLTETGAIRYKDLDGNGTLNNLDRTIIGNPNPDFIYGFTNNFSYKNFTLNVFLQGIQGADIFNFNLSNQANAFNFGENQVRSSLDRWTTENPNPAAKNPKVSIGSTFRESNRFVEDGSFLRLKNIRLAYTLPLTKWSVNWLKSAQIYVSGQNLLTFTKYSWYDPEVSSRGGAASITVGIDQTSYPVAKTYTCGVSLAF